MKKADLTKILAVLRRLNIPVVLVGGYAVAAWGAVRATRDIDLLISVLKALPRAWQRNSRKRVSRSITEKAMRAIPCAV